MFYSKIPRLYLLTVRFVRFVRFVTFSAGFLFVSVGVVVVCLKQFGRDSIFGSVVCVAFYLRHSLAQLLFIENESEKGGWTIGLRERLCGWSLDFLEFSLFNMYEPKAYAKYNIRVYICFRKKKSMMMISWK